MGFIGRKASEKLDNATPTTTAGKAAKLAAKGARGIHRGILGLGSDDVTSVRGAYGEGLPIDGRCQMRGRRRSGKVCDNRVKRNRPTCENPICTAEFAHRFC